MNFMISTYRLLFSPLLSNLKVTLHRQLSSAAPPPEAKKAVDVKQIIQNLLWSVSYATPSVTFDKERLENAIMLEITNWEVDDGHESRLYRRIAQQAAALIEYSYFHHDFEIKVQCALYSWFMIFIDDLSTRMPEAIAQFQRRMISGEHQLDPVLDQFPRVLGNLYKHWDPVAANCMVCATLEFISGNGMEGKKEISAMAPSKDAVTWPRFLRAKTGAAPGYSWTVFPIRYHSDMSVYVQAIPDMDDFINLVNDILSFYKENLARDEMTYVVFRSKITDRPSLDVLSDMVRNVAESHRRIVAILSGCPTALAAWKTFEDGFIAWHLSLERYRLSELGFQM